MLCSVHKETRQETPAEVLTALTGCHGQPQPEAEVLELLPHLHHCRHAASVDKVVLTPLLPVSQQESKDERTVGGVGQNEKVVWTVVTANGMLLCIATQVHFMHPTHHEKADGWPHSHAHTAVCCLQ